MTEPGLSNKLTLGVGLARSVAVLPWPATLDPLLAGCAAKATVGAAKWFKARRAKRKSRKALKHGHS